MECTAIYAVVIVGTFTANTTAGTYIAEVIVNPSTLGTSTAAGT